MKTEDPFLFRSEKTYLRQKFAKEKLIDVLPFLRYWNKSLALKFDRGTLLNIYSALIKIGRRENRQNWTWQNSVSCKQNTSLNVDNSDISNANLIKNDDISSAFCGLSSFFGHLHKRFWGDRNLKINMKLLKLPYTAADFTIFTDVGHPKVFLNAIMEQNRN